MGAFFDEMSGTGGGTRLPYSQLEGWVQNMPLALRSLKQAEAEALFRRIGITFAVYGEGGDPDRLIPFDMFPRVFSHPEWTKLERGIKQRARALNAFLTDVYGRGEIVRAGRIPGRLVYQNEAYEKAVSGFTPPKGVYSHIVGIDLVRTGPDEFFVLEDNCRTPSGVSYMLENREIMMRMFPALFRENRIQPVDSYPEMLRRTLASVAPVKCKGEPKIVILTPGHFNSAYYEHSFLADLMGVELVEGQDLFVDGEFVYARTTEGPKRVDVIYRRIDDAFLDPLCFRPDSMLGVPGLMDVYRSGALDQQIGLFEIDIERDIGLGQQRAQPLCLAGARGGHPQIGLGKQRRPGDPGQQPFGQIAVQRHRPLPWGGFAGQLAIRQGPKDLGIRRLQRMGIGNRRNQTVRTFDCHIAVGRQILRAIGKTRIDAEFGAGQHKGITLTVAADGGQDRRHHAKPRQGHGDIHRHAPGQAGDAPGHIRPQPHRGRRAADDVPKDRTDAKDIGARRG